MGVRTTADEEVEKAQTAINDAIQSLSAIVIGECWGHDGYNREYRETLSNTMHSLLKLREDLRNY